MKVTLVSLFAALLQIAVGITGDPNQLKPPAGTSSEKDKCTVSGRATNIQTGEPLKKANLHLTLHRNTRSFNGSFESTGYSGVSGPDGSFKFEAVEPGEYSLSGEKPGYIQTQYGSKNGMTGGTTLNLQPGQQMADVKMQLVPQATISGRVLDDDGDPVGNVRVEAVGRMWGQGGKPRYFPMGQASTDDTGAFRIANLRPGKYYVAVQSNRSQMMGLREAPAAPGKPDIRPVRTFYPSSLDRTGASAIDLKPGQEMPGIDVRMRSVETFHIRGKLSGVVAESNGQPGILMLSPQGGDALPFSFGSAFVAKDGTFDFAGIPPGSYMISTANFNGQQQFASQTVDVGSANVNDVVLTAQSTFSIRGSIEIQSNTKTSLENVYVMLSPDNDSIIRYSAPSNAMAKADGTFTLEKVTPAKLRVHVMNEPDGAYLKSIRFGGQETLGKTLDLTQASGGEIHIVLRAGAAEVSGTVQTKQDTPAPASSASVILIPEDFTLNGGDTHYGNTNQSGAFTVKGIAPGTYYALAYETDEYRSLDDPAILKQLAGKGTKVDVKENDKQQIQLTLLPAGDLQAALTAAGVEN